MNHTNKNSEIETITLQTNKSTYQMGITKEGFLLHLYYGPKVDWDMSYLLTYYDRGFSGNPYESERDKTFSLDALPQEYPYHGNGDFRSHALQIKDERGIFGCDLRYVSHKKIAGKYSIPNLPAVYVENITDKENTPDKKNKVDGNMPYTVEILLRDVLNRIEVTLKYGVIPNRDTITRSTVIKNISDNNIYVEKAYSASLDFLTGEFDLLHFHGRHCMERQLERTAVFNGNQSYGSRRGTSSHQHNPFFILSDKETTEDAGACYGMSLLYSGNFKCEVEKDQFNQTRILMGIQDDMFSYKLESGEMFYTPELAMIFSKDGFTDLSQKYHKLIRYHVCRGKYKEIRRPVLINNWEATYFDFTKEKIIDIAKAAAELGVEMLVLDDGWFGDRDDDDRGLGDWFVNEKKLGGSLHEMVDEINQLGLKFGIWIEPEMVNENSQLYRKHPDWAFAIPGMNPVRSRYQLVLDYSREEVVEGIFNQIAKVIESANIEYIKMDMNRSICDVYTLTEGFQNQGMILHKYILGVYRFLEKMLTAYPNVLIEGCSGGGGRFDAGMLSYTPQIWCSDNTDAIERIKIQHGTSFGYPISAVGSHVSACPNHQTRRTTPIHTRAITAMAGSFGYELDLNTISDEEKEAVKAQITDYKKYWNMIQNGDYYRLHNPNIDLDIAAWNFVSEDKKEALLNIVILASHANPSVKYVKCKGLDPYGIYKVDTCVTTVHFLKNEYSGAALMEMGIPLPRDMDEYEGVQIYFQMKEWGGII